MVGLDLPPVEIVDVGASDLGDPPRYRRLCELGLARVTGFEPDAAQRARLSAAADENLRVLPHALGRGGGATFHVCRYPGCSSLYEPDPSVIDLFTGIGTAAGRGNFAVVDRRPIATWRLDEVEKELRADLLKIDVQGAELDVLEGAVGLLADALVVECEVEFVPVYRDQPLFGAVHMFMDRQGFWLHKLLEVSGRTLRPFTMQQGTAVPMSQMLWADAVFIRDIRTLAGLDADRLLRFATILHDAYHSYDVVHFILKEHDRRTGDAVADRYSAKLMALPGLDTQFLTVRTKS